jgi:hypothetical protein
LFEAFGNDYHRHHAGDFLLRDRSDNIWRVGDRDDAPDAGLVEDSDELRTGILVTTKREDRPKRVKCGKEMRLRIRSRDPTPCGQYKRSAATVAIDPAGQAWRQQAHRRCPGSDEWEEVPPPRAVRKVLSIKALC